MSSIPPGPIYRQKRKTVTTRKPILSKLEREFPDFYQSQIANSRPGTASSPPAVALTNPPAPSASVASAVSSIPVPQANILESPPPASSGSWKSSPLYPPSPFQLAMERQKQERDLRRAAKRKSLGDSGSVWSRASSVARSVATDRSIAMSSREVSQALSRSEFARSTMTRSRDARLEYEEKRRKEFGGRMAISPQRPTGSMSLQSFGSQISRPTSRQSNSSHLNNNNNTADNLRSLLARAKAVREDDANTKRLEDAERRKEAIRIKLEEEERARRERAMEQYISESRQQATSTSLWNSQAGEGQGSQIVISDDENDTLEERQPKRLRSEECDAYSQMQRSFYEARKDATSTVVPLEQGSFQEASRQVSASPPRKRGNDDDDDQGLNSANHKRHHGRRVDQSFVRESLSPQDSQERMSFARASASKKINGSTFDKSHPENPKIFERPRPLSFSADHGGNDNVNASISAIQDSSESNSQGNIIGQGAFGVPGQQDFYPDLSSTSTQFADGIFSTQPDNATSTQVTELAMDAPSASSIFPGPRLKLGDEISGPSKTITFHGTKSRSTSAEFIKPSPASPKRPTQHSNIPGEPSSPAYHTRSAERRHSMSTRRSSQLTSSPEIVTSPTTPRVFTNPMVVLDRSPSSHLKSPPSTVTAGTMLIQKTAVNKQSKTSILHLEKINQTQSTEVTENNHEANVQAEVSTDNDPSVAVNQIVSETTCTIQDTASLSEKLAEDVLERTKVDDEDNAAIHESVDTSSAVLDSKKDDPTSQVGNTGNPTHLEGGHEHTREEVIEGYNNQEQDTEEPVEQTKQDEDAEGSADDGYYPSIQDHNRKYVEREEDHAGYGSTEDNPDYFEDEDESRRDEAGYGDYAEGDEEGYDDDVDNVEEEGEEEEDEEEEDENDEAPDREERNIDNDEEDDYEEEDEEDYDTEDEDDSLARHETSGPPEVITIDSDSD